MHAVCLVVRSLAGSSHILQYGISDDRVAKKLS